MYSFGKRSKQELATCCDEINVICNEAILIMDFSVLQGRRNKAEQNRLYAIGKSYLEWPNSAHNVADELGEECDGLSDAFDFAPWPVDWKDREQFTLYAGVFIGIAQAKGIELVWGGDWNRNFKVDDNNFDDLGHLQVVR